MGVDSLTDFCRMLSHHQANIICFSFGISDKAITAHVIDCAVTSLSVTWAFSLGERCHSIGKRCHFLSKPKSLPRSLNRTTNGFGFIASPSRQTMPQYQRQMPFLSKPGSLPRSILRTTNGFGFRASACVVDFNMKRRRQIKSLVWMVFAFLLNQMINHMMFPTIRLRTRIQKKI